MKPIKSQIDSMQRKKTLLSEKIMKSLKKNVQQPDDVISVNQIN